MAGGWLGPLLGAAVVTLVAVGTALAVRPGGRFAGDAVEILRSRFARGEVSAEEFEQAKRALGA